MLAMQIRGRETQLGNPLKRKKKQTHKQKTTNQQSGWNTESAFISLPTLLISLKSWSQKKNTFIIQRKANSHANIDKKLGLTQEMERVFSLLEAGYSQMPARICYSCTHSLHNDNSVSPWNTLCDAVLVVLENTTRKNKQTLSPLHSLGQQYQANKKT